MTSQPLAYTVTNPGSGYANIPNVYVDPPTGYRKNDNVIWTGKEWIAVGYIDENLLYLYETLNYDIPFGSNLYFPYDYHKPQFNDPGFSSSMINPVFNQFYHFIHATAINPSTEMLNYVVKLNNVQSEYATGSTTSSFPLINSDYFKYVLGLTPSNNLYNEWVYEGSAYPSVLNYPLYSSEILSEQSRLPFESSTQCAFNYINTSISDSQQILKKNSQVVFSYDNCKIPGKNNPIWTICNQDTGKLECQTSEEKFMWNFSRLGNFQVSLQIEDSNGNVSTGSKNSFILIE